MDSRVILFIMEKRVLSEEEIKSVLSFIQPLKGIPLEIAQSIAERQFNNHAKQLRGLAIYPSKIPELSEKLKRHYFHSQIDPGKSVGALSSTSIGEKNTQSIIGSDQVLVFHQGEVRWMAMETICEFYLDALEEKTIVPPYHLLVPSVNTDEQVEWKPVYGIVRHHYKDKVLRITTEHGKVITGTKCHSFLVQGINGIQAVLGSELKEGDYMPIADHIPFMHFFLASARDVLKRIERIPFSEVTKIPIGGALLFPFASSLGISENAESISKSDFIRYYKMLKRETHVKCQRTLSRMKQLVDSDVCWDKIISIEPIDWDDVVYDFTVPGTETFLVNDVFVHNSTLNSFHQAGQSKVELLVGVPRLEEILNITKPIKTPSMDIHLDLPLEQLKNLNYVRRLAYQNFCYKEVISFVKNYDIRENREVSIDEQFWYQYNSLFQNDDFEQCTWSIRLQMDVNQLYGFGKTLKSIADTIHQNYADAHCVISPDDLGIIDVYVNTENLGDVGDLIASIKSVRKKTKKQKDEEGEDDSAESKEEKKKKRITDENLSILLTDENKEKYFIRDLVVPSILYLQVNGIEGIANCFFQEGKDGGWYVTTKGSNLKVVLRHPLVNPSKTVSNHLWDNYDVFGIEGTKTYLRKEMSKLITISARHLEVLIDCMTHSGKLQAASRYGIDRKQVGVLAKASFETPWENFFSAAAACERENMSGVSASITAGKLSLQGSGCIQMIDAGSGTLINTDELEHVNAQEVLKRLKEEGPRPGFVARFKKPAEVSSMTSVLSSIPEEGTGKVMMKKSKVNSMIKRPVTVSASGGGGRLVNTVTRIIMSDPTTMSELDRLGRPDSSLFNTPGGSVIEHESY